MRACVTVLALVAIVSVVSCGGDSTPTPHDAASDARAGETGAADTGTPHAAADTAAPDTLATPSDAAAGPAAADGATDRASADAAISDAAGADVTPDIAVDSPASDSAGPAAVDAAAPDTAPGSDTGADAGPTTFMILDPCLSENSYVTGPPTVSFRVTTDKPGYAPPCLKVRQGTQVTFTAVSESFVAHPLEPRMEGSPNNPITLTTVGTSATFSLPAPGFFPYHCMIHQSAMVGVIWVTE